MECDYSILKLGLDIGYQSGYLECMPENIYPSTGISQYIWSPPLNNEIIPLYIWDAIILI